MRRIKARFLAAMTLAVVAASTVLAVAVPAQATTGSVTPVPQLDVSRYLGDWYQVAAVPAIYELQCSGNAKAHYSLNSNGTVAVLNSCKTWLGTTSSINGTARVDNAPKNSALSVSFLSIFGTPIYTGTNYVVFGLASDYSWAVVGDPARQSGFVLSRTPALTSSQRSTILSDIANAGYSSCAFKVTPQTGGLSTSAGFC